MGRMNPRIKDARNVAKLAAALKNAGFDPGIKADEIEQVAAEVKSSLVKTPTFFEAEAALLLFQKPKHMIIKKCRRCRDPFASSYRSVAYCGDVCRQKQLFELTGIRWDPHKSDEERWGGEPPLIVPPSLLKRMLELVAENQYVESSSTTPSEPFEQFEEALSDKGQKYLEETVHSTFPSRQATSVSFQPLSKRVMPFSLQ
jgi:hypothetical protein